MTSPLTVDEARRLIALCREVDARATPGEWFLSGGQIRSLWDHDGRNLYVCRAGDMDIHNPAALLLWRAGFGALLAAIENLMQHATPHPVGSIADALTPLAEWADREHQGWRTR